MHEANLSGRNHPLAVRMGAIAFTCQTVSLACMWGTFGVLMAANETRLGINRELSALGVPLVTVSTALLSPVIGAITSKISLRLLMLLGICLEIAGYALLASTNTLALYLVGYGLLIGPGMSLSGMMLPSMLVTRWFTYNRGRALGFCHLPLMIVILPLVCNHIMKASGPQTVYAVLAVLMALILVPAFFIVDYPPSAIDPSGSDVAAEHVADPGLSLGQILSVPTYWTYVLALAVTLSSSILFGAHEVAMAVSWGIDSTLAAGLLTITSLSSVFGMLLFGWCADKLGGRRLLMIIACASILLWALLLTQPPVALLALLVGLIGITGAAAMPAFGLALSQLFGQSSFERGFGTGSLLALPFLVGAAPVGAAIFVGTGSYMDAILLYACLFVVTALLLFIVRPRSAALVARPA